MVNVLVADDNSTLCSTLERLVVQAGHTCVVATTGQQAYAALRGGYAFDLIVSDWELPNAPGLELFRRAKDTDAAGHYTVFTLLAHAEKRSELLHALRSGVDAYLIKPIHADDFRAQLMNAERLSSVRARLLSQQAELDALNAEIDSDSHRDRLTRLANARRLQEDLQAMNARVARYGHRYSLALIDVDFFGKYNDVHGRTAGDQALRTVASTIAGQCRSGDVAYRYEGAVFIVVLPEQTPDKAAIGVERMRRAIESLTLPHPANPFGIVTVSAGVAGLAPAGQSIVEAPIPEADEALHCAKERGRNRTHIFDPLTGEVRAAA